MYQDIIFVFFFIKFSCYTSCKYLTAITSLTVDLTKLSDVRVKAICEKK